MGDSTSEADPTSQKPHEEAHLTEVREVPTTWRTDFELGKALRARQGGQQGRWCSLCWFCKNQHKQANQGCTDLSGTIRRRQRAVQIGPHMSRGPAGQSPTRLSHHASQEALKPGLCFSANGCPGTWRRRRVRACIDPHTGSASRQRIHKPSADAEAPMAEPRRATCPAQAGVRVCARRFWAACKHATCTQGGACRTSAACAIEGYAPKASSPDVLSRVTVSS